MQQNFFVESTKRSVGQKKLVAEIFFSVTKIKFTLSKISFGQQKMLLHIYQQNIFVDFQKSFFQLSFQQLLKELKQ